MNKKKVIQIVGIDCGPEVEGKFNKWYENVHIPLLLKFKRLRKVTRYTTPEPAGDYPKYLSVMEFDNKDACDAYNSSPELAAAREESKQTWGGKGYEVRWRVRYQAIKIFER